MRAGRMGLGAWGQSLLAIIWMVCGAFGQTASDLGEGLRAELTSTAGVTAIKWWGKAGRTYFVQSSETLQSGSWQYMPVVEAGADAVCTWNLQTSASKMFVRLVYTDQLYAGAAGAADFDGDGVSNAQEVSITGPHTDPFLADSDWDGSSDGAELTAGTSPTSSQSNTGGSTTPSGPLNPDSRYRHGIRFDYSWKGMWADYYGLVETPQPPEFHHTYAGVYTSNTAGTTFVYGPTHNYTADKTAEALETWTSAAFPTPDITLFNSTSGWRWMDGYWTESSSTSSSGRTIYKNNERIMFNIQAQASTGAPSWARRSVALIDFLNGYGTDKIVKEGRVMFSTSNAQASDAIREHVSSGSEPGSAVITPKLAANEWHSLQLFDVDIEPVAGLAGTIGDMVPSVQGEKSFVRHFVTPKKTDELPQEFVELTAGAITLAKFDQLFEWDCEGGQQGSDSRFWKVSRNTPAVTKLKIKTKKTKVVVSEMHVWVVWATCTPTLRTASWDIQQIPTGNQVLIFGTWQPEMVNGGKKWYVPNSTGSRHKFVFTIEPNALFDPANQEVPDLKGNARTPVPGDGKPYKVNLNASPADSATTKWDVSRQSKIVIRNPYGIPKVQLEQTGSALFDNQPVANDTPVPWPTNPAEGNDDPPSADEDGNPYDQNSDGDLSHIRGQLSSIDAPSFAVLNGWASTGGYLYTYGTELNFREFCRLEITDGARSAGNTWFRISAYWSWHHYLRAAWDGLDWYDGGSQSGSGHPTP